MAPVKATRAVMATEVLNNSHPVPNKAYVTFLAGNGDYIKGIVGLAKGLRKVKSKYPLLVAVLPDVPEEHREIARSQGCTVREIEPIHPPKSDTQFALAYYVINYSKLRIWDFVEYEKMMYLDADIQVYENIDHLLDDTEDGYLYAAMDCFCEKNWRFSPQYKVGYCQQCPDRVKWPEHMGSPPPLYFNAGMFVFEPSHSVYENLLETLRVTPVTSFAEQDFLNMYFNHIYKPLPLEYNLILAMLWRHPENFELDKVKVVHYCANGSKPWRYTGEDPNMDREDIKMLIAKWWDIYNDPSLDYKPAENGINSIDDEGLSRSSIMASMPEPKVSYVPAPPAA
ncbi:hypothetical protein Syun_024108 [Stephania yunnanensis]|uniref:Hexosyltransferase n=1 Tax=Stephania yunnanensis TaxID=152371 RepID=A0AAP0FEG6_9MAGN